MPREHERGVAQRLAARELKLLGAKHDGVASQLGDPDLERQSRARRGLLEDQRHAPALERPRGAGLALELERPVQQPVELGGAQLRPREKMTLGHEAASLGATPSRSAWTGRRATAAR